jgi:methionine sulfoxide reductase heme-binding subunit
MGVEKKGFMTNFAVASASPRGRRVPWNLYVAVAIADALIVGLPLAMLGWTPDALLLGARYTARFSFLWFLMVFVSRPLATMWPGPATRWMLRRQRHLGLTFALAHFIHLGALAEFVRVSGRPANPVTVIVGGFGYVMLALMAATSNDASVRRLGANWKRIHRFGMYYLLFVFVATYLTRFTMRKAPEPLGIYVGLLTLAVCAVGIRVVAMRSRREAGGGAMLGRAMRRFWMAH